MHPDRLVAALLAITFPIFSIWLLRRASNEHEECQTPNVKVVRFTKSWRIWWYSCCGLFLLGFSSDIYLGKVKPDERLSYWLTFLGFAVLLGIGTWFLLGYKVEYDEEGLSVCSPPGRSRRILWSNVIGAEFKKGTGIVLNLRSGKRQVIPSLLPGVDEILKEANARASRAANRGRSSGRQHWPWLRHFHGQCWYPPHFRCSGAAYLGVRRSGNASIRRSCRHLRIRACRR
jgi:hypothetical protein